MLQFLLGRKSNVGIAVKANIGCMVRWFGVGFLRKYIEAATLWIPQVSQTQAG